MQLDSVRICGCKDAILESATLCQWPDGDLPWAIVDLVPGVSEDEFRKACLWALAQWSRTGGVTPRQVDSAREARLLIGSRRIDGSGSILAECELPCGGVRQCRMWLDTGERWITDMTPQQRGIMLPLVIWHEAGHGIGLGHAPQGSSNIMAPAYNPKQMTAGEWDTAECRRRYGPAKTPLPPNPSPTPQPEGPSMTRTLILQFMRWANSQFKSYAAGTADPKDDALAYMFDLILGFFERPNLTKDEIAQGMNEASDRLQRTLA